MITKLSHATVWVLDQEESRRFYTEKLGFTVVTDATMDNGFRWLTVSPPGQPDLQIVLMATTPTPMIDAETSAQIRALVQKGVMGAGVFETPDCRATYEELKRRGVEFMAPPEEKFYGIEALLRDNSGNWFSMTQRVEQPATPPAATNATTA